MTTKTTKRTAAPVATAPNPAPKNLFHRLDEAEIALYRLQGGAELLGVVALAASDSGSEVPPGALHFLHHMMGGLIKSTHETVRDLLNDTGVASRKAKLAQDTEQRSLRLLALKASNTAAAKRGARP